MLLLVGTGEFGLFNFSYMEALLLLYILVLPVIALIQLLTSINEYKRKTLNTTIIFIYWILMLLHFIGWVILLLKSSNITLIWYYSSTLIIIGYKIVKLFNKSNKQTS